jgi:CHAD domain-containing protein
MAEFKLTENLKNELFGLFKSCSELLIVGDSVSLHEARKKLKFFRAYLRLIRNSIAIEDFEILNNNARDIARTLAGLRDFDSAVEACNRNYKQLNSHQRNLTTRIKNKLINQKEKYKEHIPNFHDQNIDAIKLIKKSLQNIKFENISHVDIIKSYVKMYKKAKLYAFSLDAEDNVYIFHEWRKKIKYLRYQTQLLMPCWPIYFSFTETELHLLSDVLGNMQDNKLITTFIEEHKFLGDTSKEIYNELTQHLNQTLKYYSIQLGQRLFAHATRIEFQKIYASCTFVSMNAKLFEIPAKS